MATEQIVCIFCGNKAKFVKRKGVSTVLCGHCSRETESHAYRIMIDKWLGDILMGDNGRKQHLDSL